jgi:hypothetical protein
LAGTFIFRPLPLPLAVGGGVNFIFKQPALAGGGANFIFSPLLLLAVGGGANFIFRPLLPTFAGGGASLIFRPLPSPPDAGGDSSSVERLSPIFDIPVFLAFMIFGLFLILTLLPSDSSIKKAGGYPASAKS